MQVKPQKKLTSPFTLLAVALLVPTLLYLIGVWGVFPFVIDDSYISMRYASNLAAGHGLVFNPGGAHLEGYTNFLLVVAEAALIKLGFRELTPVKLLTALSGLMVLVVVAGYGWQRLRQRYGSHADHGPLSLWLVLSLCVLLIATSSPLILWSVSGLETALFAFLASLGVATYLVSLGGKQPLSFRALAAAQICLALSTLVRPEGLLFWGITSAHAVGTGIIRRQRGKQIAGSIGIGVGLLAVYGAWKLSYFGQLLPATFFAKQNSLGLLNFVLGIARWAGFLLINGNGFVFAATVIGLIVLIRQRRFAVDSPVCYLAGLGGAYTVYALSLGFNITMGDAYRFYVPLIPITSLLLFEVALSHVRRIPAPVLVAGCLIAMALLVPLRLNDLWTAWRLDFNWGIMPYRLPAQDEVMGVEQGYIALGQWLHDHAAPDSKIVLWDAGAISYFSGLYTVDTWSLTEPKLIDLRRALLQATSDAERAQITAEMRAYVLAFEPDYIIQDNLNLLADPGVAGLYRKLDQHFAYLDWYMCGPQLPCRYPLDIWQRQDQAVSTSPMLTK